MEWTVNYTSEKNYKNSTSAMGLFFFYNDAAII